MATFRKLLRAGQLIVRLLTRVAPRPGVATGQVAPKLRPADDPAIFGASVVDDSVPGHPLAWEHRVDINHALFESSVDGIRLVDLAGRTLLANSVIEQLSAEVFKLPAVATLHESSGLADRLADPASYLATLEEIASDPECQTQDSFELADAHRAFHRHTEPVRDSAGELIGRIIVIREITADWEAARLKAEIATQREAAQVKSELVATVSHELRTPLTSVLGFAELLMRRDLDEVTRQRYLQTIHGEAKRLTALVDDFLDLEKIEAGRFTLALESFELSALLEYEVQLFAAQSAKHQLEFEPPDEPLKMVGDRDRIGQVIANLLSNAIKYSPGGGVVTVRVTASEGFARVLVSDPGLGIPAGQRAQVFTKFFRVDSTDTREIGGTGLGLALCQEIVTAHGGRIGFDTTVGVGTTFWIELPTSGRLAVAAHGPRVLVIEDDAERAAAVADRLTLDGLQVDTQPTGALGLARALAWSPAVICLDIDLPDELDRWQVLVRLKSNPATAEVPVVVCAEPNRRGTAAALGAAHFLSTPYTPEQLGQAVVQQLSAERSSILVVGEDHGLRRLVVETLARDGGDLREAADELQALALIAARQPDVLVLNLALSGVDGFAAIERLLERPEARGLPVVVLTGPELSSSERRYLQERSALLLEKRKFSADQLRRLVHRAPAASQHVVRVAARAVLDCELPEDDAPAPAEVWPSALPAAVPLSTDHTETRHDVP